MNENLMISCFLCLDRCHGEAGNIVYALGKGFDCFSSSIARNDRLHLIHSNGQRVDDVAADELMELAMAILDSDEIAEWNGSLGDFIEVR